MERLRNLNPFLIALFIIIAIQITTTISIIVIVRIRKFIKNKRMHHIVATSSKLTAIKELNQNYTFVPIEKIVRDCNCNSKRDFDRRDLRSFLIECIQDDPDYFLSALTASEQNAELFSDYINKYQNIINAVSQSEQDLYEKYPYYTSMERAVCETERQKPCCSLTIRVVKRYRSPKGRNHYQESDDFTHSMIKEAYEVAIQKNNESKSAGYQRPPISESMRYDIMKRDQFRCVLCGAAACDGVMLEIDHILPVSKGGTSAPANLRTLCRSCNRGKAAKYDPNGLN